MAVAHDASTQFAAFTTAASVSVIHTPVGTPRGVIVQIVQNVGITDDIVGVTYGGVAMTRIHALNPGANPEPGRVYAYFLGSGVPALAQTVQINCTGGASSKRAVVTTVTAASDVAVDSSPSRVVSSGDSAIQVDYTAAGQLAYVAMHMGYNAVPAAPSPGTTVLFTHDFGNQTASWLRSGIVSSGAGSVVLGWPSAADDNVSSALVLAQAAAATYEEMDASVLGAATISLVGLDPLMDLSVPIVASGAVAADLTGYSDASATIAGTSSLAATLGMLMDATAAIVGTSLITSDLTLYNPVDMNAAIAAGGLVAADLTGYSDVAASIAASGSVAASLGLVSDATAAVSGSAALVASLDFVQDLTASLASQATLTADLTPMAFADMSTGITASGVMTSDLGMLRDLSASMAASGAVTGTLGIVTDLSAGINSGAVVAGDLGSLMDLAAALSASALVAGDLTFLLAAGTTPDLRGPLVALVLSDGGHATMIDLTAHATSPDHDGRASSDNYSARASQPSNEVGV